MVLGATAPLRTAGWNTLRNSFEFPLLLKLFFYPVRVPSEMRREGTLNVSAVIALHFSLVTVPALLKPEAESLLSGVKV